MGNHPTRRTLLKATAAGGLGLPPWRAFSGSRVQAARPEDARTPAVLRKGVRQLFLDDALVDDVEGLRRVVHQPAKYEENPIIRSDRPWQRFRAQVYGTALYDPDEKRFKIWYLAGARLPFEEPVTINGRLCCPNFQSVGYATSTDGFHFDLPNLGLVHFNGSAVNNLCRIARQCVEGISVLHDPQDPDPGRRYKALYWEHFVPYKGSPGTAVNGMSVSFSADGTTWTNHPGNPVMPMGSDTGQQVLWDPARRKYVAYGRFGAGGRKVARSESPDFVHWSKPERVFAADDDDDGAGTQIYGMGVSRYEDVYLGMPWIFREGSTHKIDVQLAVSRDGIRWNRVADRQTFIPNGPEGSWDAGILFTASRPVVRVDDKIHLYYSASRHDHDYRKRPAKGSPEWKPYWDSIRTSIGVATLRRDGFVSLDAGDAPGRLVTSPLVWPEGTRLHLNADASQGTIAVEMRDAAHRPTAGAERARAVSGDVLDETVAWPEKQLLARGGRAVRLVFTLHNAKLYSFWFA